MVPEPAIGPNGHMWQNGASIYRASLPLNSRQATGKPHCLHGLLGSFPIGTCLVFCLEMGLLEPLGSSIPRGCRGLSLSHQIQREEPFPCPTTLHGLPELLRCQRSPLLHASPGCLCRSERERTPGSLESRAERASAGSHQAPYLGTASSRICSGEAEQFCWSDGGLEAWSALLRGQAGPNPSQRCVMLCLGHLETLLSGPQGAGEVSLGGHPYRPTGWLTPGFGDVTVLPPAKSDGGGAALPTALACSNLRVGSFQSRPV